MDSSSISLSVLRSSSKTSPIPLSFVPPTTLIGYRWACLRTKYTDYPIKPLNCPFFVVLPIWNNPTHLCYLIPTLFYCCFSKVFRGATPHSLGYAYSIDSGPSLRYFNSMGRMGVRSGYGSLTRNKITRRGFAWGGLTYDHSYTISEFLRLIYLEWAHFSAFSSHDLRIGSITTACPE